MTVRAYIDAAYGMHSGTGKSHIGCAIVLGDAGAFFAKSSQQKIVTKSSTEAELVGLSDTAMQEIHLRNFVQAQGNDIGPVVIYQDNMSCMALMKRGGPGSERSRHINIRYMRKGKRWRGYHRTSGHRENVRSCTHQACTGAAVHPRAPRSDKLELSAILRPGVCWDLEIM